MTVEYTELDVWKKSRELVKDIYQITQQFPKSEVYGLTNQMRKSAISIPSKITEANLQKPSTKTQPSTI